MKKLLVLPVFAIVLMGCGSEYDDTIDGAITYYHEEGAYVDDDIETKDNAEILVWDDGRYISAVFFDEEGNETGDFVMEQVRGNFTEQRGDVDRMRENADADYKERFGEEID
ncbi:hypothetical protein SAMN04488123_1116 [Natribacillus halophilus]|uniref:DUF4467 domain-containing protein n=2 Tax=Natribacillus halophilus TaxID=549003 RepID=A0A1G8Q8P6_9BACI|nr:hypothetical protein SAMN04488123_1116 [Natribacillus halophilus]